MNGQEAGDSWRVYDAPETDEVERENRDTSGKRIEPPPAKRRSPVVPLLVGVGVVGAGVAGIVLVGGDREREPDPLPAEGSYQPIIDQATLDAVAAGLEEATGDTAVLTVWVDGTDGIRLTVPPGPGEDLADEYSWDGQRLERYAAAKPLEEEVFRLDVIDPGVLVRVDEEARSRTDGDISDSRAKIAKPVLSTDSWIYLRVDEVDHGGVVLWADLEGEIESDLVNEDWRDD